MKIICYGIVLSLLICCQNVENSNNKEKSQNLNQNSTENSKLKLIRLKDLYQSNKYFDFVRYGICNNDLTISSKKCTLFFMNQCAYEFTCRFIDNKIEVLWDYELDCLVHNVLDSIVKAINYPKKNEVIGAFYLGTDTTLIFEAYNKKKLERLNQSFGKSCDTLFPKKWILNGIYERAETKKSIIEEESYLKQSLPKEIVDLEKLGIIKDLDFDNKYQEVSFLLKTEKNGVTVDKQYFKIKEQAGVTMISFIDVVELKSYLLIKEATKFYLFKYKGIIEDWELVNDQNAFLFYGDGSVHCTFGSFFKRGRTVAWYDLRHEVIEENNLDCDLSKEAVFKYLKYSVVKELEKGEALFDLNDFCGYHIDSSSVYLLN